MLNIHIVELQRFIRCVNNSIIVHIDILSLANMNLFVIFYAVEHSSTVICRNCV